MTKTRFWISVAAVAEEVDVHFRNLQLFGDIEKSLEVKDMRVLRRSVVMSPVGQTNAYHSSIANQSAEMEPPVAILRS